MGELVVSDQDAPIAVIAQSLFRRRISTLKRPSDRDLWVDRARTLSSSGWPSEVPMGW